MAEIKIMSPDLSNKIAAGEVIENQASVVKELVENSIDANASRIEISLIDSGLQLIQVIDNGKGMSKEDLLMCFHPHATSKISNQYDLFNINTLGFRGEALASIVSIAKVRISTNDQKSSGYNLDILEEELSEGYANQGTKFSVYNLFYNVPARLKHLKSQKSELANIVDLVAKYSLTYPQISITLVSDGKTILKTVGNGNLMQIISTIYSIDSAKNMQEISFKSTDFMVDGYIGNNKATRANKRGINIFINKRLVYNPEIEKAIIRGYGDYLMEKRYPLVIINISCDYQLIDVNVHPAKREVRVSKIDELCELIEKGIKNKFGLIQKEFLVKEKNSQINQQAVLDLDYKPPKPQKISEGTGTIKYPTTFTKREESIQTIKTKEDTYPTLEEMKVIDDEVIQDIKEIDEKLNRENKQVNDEVKENVKISLNAIGQFAASYVLAQSERGLHIIDQHAAMERINYEKMIEHSRVEQNEYQDLIVPIVVPLTLSEKIKVMILKDKLGEIGINVEEQANNDVIVRMVPTWVESNFANEYVQKTIEYCLELQDVKVNDVKKEDLILASCKMSLKANQYLTIAEQQQLLDDLIQTNNYDHCPHGRPIIITYSKTELEKLFKRIV